MKTLFTRMNSETHSTPVALALLGLRVVVGVAFILHGSGKLAAPMSWMGPDAAVPGFLQALAVLTEFGGGIALIAGLLVPLASLGLITTMIGALIYHLRNGDPYLGGYELPLVYLTISAVLGTVGAGRFSADYLIASAAAPRRKAIQ